MDINGHLLTPIWEVPPIWHVQTCIAPLPYRKRRPGEGAAISYIFSPGAGGGKGETQVVMPGLDPGIHEKPISRPVDGRVRARLGQFGRIDLT